MIDTNNSKIGNPFPFRVFCQKVIPLAFDESLSYLELLYSLLHYIKEIIIPAVNNNADAVEELQNLYNELKSYVDNYFENLDVQEEINNKLDEMAESGQLTDMIAQYLQLAGILAYNTINDLKNAENLINGSFAKTYGKNSYNDGLGAFYKIRNILNTDVVDNDNIVALTNFNNLIAEKVKLTLSKKYLLVGDSYGEGYSGDGDVESWCIKFKNIMGLDSSNCTILVGGGYGFAATNKFEDLIETATNDIYLTDIILLGGYNDRFSTYNNIKTGMENFKNKCIQKFPNAKIHIGFVGWSNNPEKLFGLRSTCINYLECCKILNIPYLNNMDYSLHEYFRSFSSDDFHPNVHGQEMIAKSLVNAINTGDANVIFNYSDFNMAMNYDFTTTTTITSAITMNMINNIIYFALKFQMKLDCNNLTINCNNTKYNVGDITAGLIIGNTYKTVTIPVNAIIHAGSDYHTIPATILIDDKKIKIAFYGISDDLHYFRTFTNVTDIQIQPFSTAIDASIN